MESHLLSVWRDVLALGTPEMTNDWEHWVEKLLRPVAVYLFLVFSLRWFGKRMLAQLNPFDLVVLLTLSNTVQNAIIGNDTSLLGGLVGAASLMVCNALLVRRDVRNLLRGQPGLPGHHPDHRLVELRALPR